MVRPTKSVATRISHMSKKDIYQVTFSINYYYNLAANESDNVLATEIIYKD